MERWDRLLLLFISLLPPMDSFPCFTIAGTHEGYIPMFLAWICLSLPSWVPETLGTRLLEPNNKLIPNPTVHETQGNNRMETRPLGQECNKQCSLLIDRFENKVTSYSNILLLNILSNLTFIYFNISGKSSYQRKQRKCKLYYAL